MGLNLGHVFRNQDWISGSSLSHSLNLNLSLWFYLEMLSEEQNRWKSLPKRIFYSTKNIVVVMYGNKSRHKIQEKNVGFQDPLWECSIIYYHSTVYYEYQCWVHTWKFRSTQSSWTITSPLQESFLLLSLQQLPARCLQALCWALQMTDSYWGMDINWMNFTSSTSVFVLPRETGAVLSYKADIEL